MSRPNEVSDKFVYQPGDVEVTHGDGEVLYDFDAEERKAANKKYPLTKAKRDDSVTKHEEEK